MFVDMNGIVEALNALGKQMRGRTDALVDAYIAMASNLPNSEREKIGLDIQSSLAQIMHKELSENYRNEYNIVASKLVNSIKSSIIPSDGTVISGITLSEQINRSGQVEIQLGEQFQPVLKQDDMAKLVESVEAGAKKRHHMPGWDDSNEEDNRYLSQLEKTDPALYSSMKNWD